MFVRSFVCLFVRSFVRDSVPFVELLQSFTLKILKRVTVKILNIQTPQKLAVITLKFKQDGFTEE